MRDGRSWKLPSNSIPKNIPGALRAPFLFVGLRRLMADGHQRTFFSRQHVIYFTVEGADRA